MEIKAVQGADVLLCVHPLGSLDSTRYTAYNTELSTGKQTTTKEALEVTEEAARSAKNWCLQKVLEEKLANEVKLSRAKDANAFLLELSPSNVDELFEDLFEHNDTTASGSSSSTESPNVFLTPERRVVSNRATYSPAARQLQFRNPPVTPSKLEDYSPLGMEEKRALRKKQSNQKAQWAVANAMKKYRTA
jgi:hypothetical protein